MSRKDVEFVAIGNYYLVQLDKKQGMQVIFIENIEAGIVCGVDFNSSDRVEHWRLNRRDLEYWMSTIPKLLQSISTEQAKCLISTWITKDEH